MLRFEALEVQARALPPGGEPNAPERDAFRDASRTFGEEAIKAKRADLVARIGQLLSRVGERALAEAFLQRSVGLMGPAAGGGKDHLYPLAELKRSQGRILEAASLFERAIDVEPTTPAEFVGLSDLYLAADRLGPARAAVTRGLAKHPDAVSLLVQGAEVDLMAGDMEKAKVALATAKAKDPTDLAARILEIEVQLASGPIDAAAELAGALRTQAAESAWGSILGAAAARAKGDAAAAEPLLAHARELAGDCPCTHEERLAISWAEGVPAGATVAPRKRAEPMADPVLSTSPAASTPSSAPASPAPTP